MSILRCDFCDVCVDTDYDVEGFCDDEKFRCPLCLEDYYDDMEQKADLVVRDSATTTQGEQK